jgi:RNA recognition motif-containing protein
MEEENPETTVFITQCDHLRRLENPHSELRESFLSFGAVKEARLFGPPNGPFKGAGSVTFETKESARLALDMKRVMCHGANVLVKEYESRIDRKRRKSPERSSPQRLKRQRSPHRTRPESPQRVRNQPSPDQGPFQSYEVRKMLERQSQGPVVDESINEWTYVDPKGSVQGPFTLQKLRKWQTRFPTGFIIKNINTQMQCPIEVALSLTQGYNDPWRNINQAIKQISFQSMQICSIDQSIMNTVSEMMATTLIQEFVQLQLIIPNATDAQVSHFLTPSRCAYIGCKTLEKLYTML